MLLQFGRGHKAPSTSGDANSESPDVVRSTPATPTLHVGAKKAQGSPSRSPSASPKKISPLHVQIPDADEDLTGMASPDTPSLPPSPSISVRPAELTLEEPSSPTSAPASAASSPQMGRAARQSQMRGLSVMSYRIKQLVSKEKRRFDGDGFNLDLTYVTDRIIAFGYPAENLEGIYRNHYKDVYNFFERRHAGKYKIYNLCAERTYDKEKFHNRVAEYPFYDHCPPPLALFVPFCEDVFAWLQANDHNVVAIHCKAGKGRTGVMICAYMLYTRMWATAYASLEFFGAARSLKREGVTIPSQQRFIRYFAKLCQDATPTDDEADDENENRTDAESLRELAMKSEDFQQLWEETIEGRGLSTKSKSLVPLKLSLPQTVRLVLTRIRISGVYAHKRIDPRVRIECGVGKMAACHEPVAAFSPVGGDGGMRPPTTAAPPRHAPVSPYRTGSTTPSSRVSTTPSSTARDGSFWSTVQLELACDRLLVWDEVKVVLRHRSGTKLGHFWFHTAFVPTEPRELTLLKDEIDTIHKDAKRGHKQFAAEFSITLVFETATPEDMAGLRATRRAHSAPDAIIASPSSTPPATPSRQRNYASMNDSLGVSPSNGGRGLVDVRHLVSGSPGRTRAVSDTPTFASVVSTAAEGDSSVAAAAATSRSPSASAIAVGGGKVSPSSGGGARSVPSSPKGFSLRFFGRGKRDTSVSVAEQDENDASRGDSDHSSASSGHS